MVVCIHGIFNKSYEDKRIEAKTSRMASASKKSAKDEIFSKEACDVG